MKISILASGSKGNATYVEINQHKMLIDAGVGFEYLKSALKQIDVSPKDLTHILITHTHSDHVKGLKTLLKHCKPIIYMTESMVEKLALNIKYCIYESTIEVEETTISVFRTSHDVEDSFAFIIQSHHKSLVYITDTGYLNLRYFKHLKNKSVYIIESNHDIEMLMNGSYPYYLKQRILGDRGHLSNKDCAYYLSELIGSKTKKIYLAHLSAENNQPDIALNEVCKSLKLKKYKGLIEVATQDQPTDVFEVE